MNKTLLAYHGDPKITPDGLCLALIASGEVLVDSENGTAFAKRKIGVNKRIGGINGKGYVVATLHGLRVRKQVKLHRLIWIAANGQIPDGLMPDHKDRNRSNNRISNLKLVDALGNAANRREYRGEGNPAAVLTASDVSRMRSMHPTKSYDRLAIIFNVSKSLVAQIIRKEIWT